VWVDEWREIRNGAYMEMKVQSKSYTRLERRLGHGILELRLLHGCGVWPSREKGMDSVKQLECD
jgi:hypothetical protein